jgi:hypothetical protein
MKEEIKKIYDQELSENILPSVFIYNFDPRNCNMKEFLNSEDRDELLKQYRADYIAKNPKPAKKVQINDYQKRMLEAELNNKAFDFED